MPQDGPPPRRCDMGARCIPPFSNLIRRFSLQKTEERSVPIAVRIHKTLELADDKSYVITCGKAGFKNAR